MQTQKSHDTTKPAPKKLTLQRETLRRLTPAELRLAAGGAIACSYRDSHCGSWTR